MKSNFKLFKKLNFLLGLILAFTLVSTSFVYAQGPDVITKSSKDVMSMDGPSVYVDLGELGQGLLQRDSKGNYSGEIKPNAAATITCVMYGNINDITNYYEIGIKWRGTEPVNNIMASKLTVSSGSEVYWSNPFGFNTGTSATGYRPIGYVVIPPDIKKVKIKTKGLQIYMNNVDYWIKLNEINGTFKL